MSLIIEPLIFNPNEGNFIFREEVEKIYRIFSERITMNLIARNMGYRM